MNNQIKFEEAKSLDYQLIASAIYICSLFLSVLITYDQKQEILNKKRIFTSKQVNNYSIFNRFLILCLTLSFLFINYRDKEIAKKYNKSKKYMNLQISASQLSVIAALIVLYVVLASEGENYNIVVGSQNPTL